MKSFFRTLVSRLIDGGSIKKKIQVSYIFIISLMLVSPVCVVSVSVFQSFRYDRVITNVSKANRLNQIVKTDISNEIWDIVAGKKEFTAGAQYEIIDTINNGIQDIMKSSKFKKNRQLLEVASRAVNTLEKYIDVLGNQIAANGSVADNEKILEDVRSVSALVYDILQDFIVVEIESAALTNESLKQSTRTFAGIGLIITAVVTLFAVSAQYSVSESIRLPIRELESLSNQIAHGNLAARAEISCVQELEGLTENLNTMAGKIADLIAENIREQQNLQKSEMKSLQAQITPHFLYNTFDTIIWLAEAGKTESVIEITRAFSNFFRISLSKGHEWITVEQEFEHVKNYLTIQKIRYRDILDYEIAYEADMAHKPLLKLVLQPLVENALYHGIKNKRGRGKLRVRGWQENNMLCFSVTDNGIGIPEERLQQIRAEIASETDSESLSSVYGLYNVNKRLNLYYNKTVNLQMESVYKEGTQVTFSVSDKTAETHPANRTNNV